MDASVSRRPPTTSLPRRADFLRVAAARRRCVTPGLILQAAPRPEAERAGNALRVGYTASRKVGNAVTRNRCKRRLREAVRQVMPLHARSGLDYVLIARDATATRPFDQLLDDLRLALRRVDAICGAQR